MGITRERTAEASILLPWKEAEDISQASHGDLASHVCAGMDDKGASPRA